MRKNLFVLVVALLASIAGISQTSTGVAINNTGADPANSAMLDVSSTLKGVLVPRMTAAQRGNIVSPAIGLLVYQTDAPEGFYFYNAASAWIYLTNSASVLPVANGGTGSSTQNFVDLTTDQTVAGNKNLSGNTTVGGTLEVTGVATLTAAPVLSSATASQALFTDASKNVVSNPTTGTGNVVMSTSPTLVTPTLGVASATSINGLTPTSAATGFTIEGGTTSKTLTVSDNATVSGTNTGDQINVTGSAASFTGSLAGDVSGTQGATVVEKINGTSMAGLSTGILKNTTTTGVPSIAVAADFPTLNQNTTGTAANVTGTVAIANGGTCAITKSAAFDALSPITTQGDVIFGGASGTGTRLAKGTAGQVLTMNSGATAPEWSLPSTIATDLSKASAMSIQTTANNADITITPHGTGKLNVQSSGTTAIATNGHIIVTGDRRVEAPYLSTPNYMNTTAGIGGIRMGESSAYTSGWLMIQDGNKEVVRLGESATPGNYGLQINNTSEVFRAGIGWNAAASAWSVGVSNGTTNGVLLAYDEANAANASRIAVLNAGSPVFSVDREGDVIAKTINGLTPASAATGFTIAGGTTSKTLTVSDNATVSGTNTGDQINVTGSAASFTGSLAGDVTGTQGSTVVEKINGTSMAGLSTGILKNTTTTGVPSIAVAADFPTLNQNTTGTAANVTGTVAIANGGTGSSTQNFVDLTTAQTIAGNKTLSGNTSVGGTLGVTGVVTLTAAPVFSSTTASQALFTDATKNVISKPITGTGNVVMSTSPTLVTPTLGVASASSINGLTPTAQATGFTIAGGTTPKTLTVPLDASVSGTNTGDNAVNSNYSGLVSNATHTGDAEGATALTVKKINGVALSGLTTGILMNTTTTGVPSIAVAGTDYLSPTTGWSLTGNALGASNTNYIGTTDDQALVFKVNSEKAGLISSGTNTSFGYQTLNVNLGNYNTSNGYQALFSNTIGNENTAIGYQALRLNTTGYDNIANGAYALYSNINGYNNTANGFSALYSNTSGRYNTANGVSALYSNISGHYNTANGYQAGRYITGGATTNTTSSNSVYLGAQTKAFADAQTNEIVIGYNATGAGSNTATLGNTSITSTVLRGNVQHYGATSGYVGLQSPATVATPYSLTLPTAAPASNGQVLSATTGGVMSWATPTTGTVTSVSGTAPVVSSGGSTPAISIPAATNAVNGYATSAQITAIEANTAKVTNATHTGDAEGATTLTVKKINGVALSGLATGIMKNTTTTGVPSIAVAADFPTLNQNTTGTAANVTGTVAIANGGTGAITKTAAFDALSPMTAAGDLIYGGTSGTGSRLAKGLAGQVLKMNAGATAPSWYPIAELPSDAASGDMAYYDGTNWKKVSAPANDGAKLIFCDGAPTWSISGTCPIEAGDYINGGVVFYVFSLGDVGYVAGEEHGLVCAATDQSSSSNWSNAFTLCDNLVLNSYADWYMPSIGELQAMCNNKTLVNVTAVANGGTAIAADYYWSSSAYGGTGKWALNANCGWIGMGVTNNIHVRAIRQF